MNRNPVTRSPRCLPRAMRFIAAAFCLLMAARSAFAQAVAGSVDPATGLSTLSTYVLGLVSTVMVIVAAWKGTHAFMEGRSIGPIAVGLLAGLVLAFGGYYILQRYGVTATAAA
jgi:hypothetical protein